MPRQPLKEKAFLALRRRCLMAIGLERGKGSRWEVLARKLAQQWLPLCLGRGVALDALVAQDRPHWLTNEYILAMEPATAVVVAAVAGARPRMEPTLRL